MGRYICHIDDWTMKRVDAGIAIASGHMPLPRMKKYRFYRSEMVTLCPSHLKDYKSDPDYIVKRIDRSQNKEVCTWCEGKGYACKVTRIVRERGRAMRDV